ncbi:MAG: NAD(P)/FAD-dependent oxidoreductase, partial [Bacteroidota bacterium]
KKRPATIRDYIKGKITEVLGKDYDVDTHFSPRYQPWDERLCAVPDNDLFLAIKEEKCTVVTDQIKTFTEQGIQLRSGTELTADLVISATGLQIKIAGGIAITVDKQPVEVSQLVNYKGVMLQDLPNLAIIMGYTNASWTLKADLACTYVCRLLQYMDRNGYQNCTPRLSGDALETAPIIDFSSGYIQRSLDQLPKQGDQFPWRLHQNYLKDLIILQYRKIEDEHLVFA